MGKVLESKKLEPFSTCVEIVGLLTRVIVRLDCMMECLENKVLIGNRNTHSLVSDFQQNPQFSILDGNEDLSAIGGMLDRILNKRSKDCLQ